MCVTLSILHMDHHDPGDVCTSHCTHSWHCIVNIIASVRVRASPLPLPRLLLRDGAADRLQRTSEWEVRPGPALLRPGWVHPVPVGWGQPSRSAGWLLKLKLLRENLRVEYLESRRHLASRYSRGCMASLQMSLRWWQCHQPGGGRHGISSALGPYWGYVAHPCGGQQFLRQRRLMSGLKHWSAVTLVSSSG